MKKSNFKKNTNSGSKTGFEHFSKILMEKMDSTVKTVTEQYGGLVRKIDKIGDDVNELKNDMAVVKPAVEKHAGDIQELKKDTREVKSELHSVKMAVMDNSHITDGIEKKLDENLEDHNKRIKKVEEKVSV